MRLDRLISEARNRPFEWGRHDCGTFAASIVRELTGRVLPLPTGYSTATGSAVAMRRKTGAADLGDAVSFFIGDPLTSPKQAQRGDIVLHRNKALGVCVGDRAFCLSESGLLAVPMTDCVTAWRV